MQILTLKKQVYRGCAIYVRNIGYHFEYLLIFKKRLYTNLVKLTPRWYRRFLKQPYTAEDMKKAVEVLYSGATLTIDKLIDPTYEEKDQKKEVEA